jgi:predicted ATPase
LAGVLPPLPPWTLTPEQEQRLVFDAVARFLINVGGPAGTLLVLDDLQWASGDALDLLAMLVRSGGETPLRIVGAYRDTEVQTGDRLAVTLGDLAQARLASRHVLGPLAPEEAAAMLDALLAHEGLPALGGAARKRLLQRGGGVPFYLVSCVHGLQPQALARHAQRGAPGDGVPWDVAEGIRQRVAALPEVGQEVVRVAAVAGREVSYGLLVTVLAPARRPRSSAAWTPRAGCVCWRKREGTPIALLTM